MISTSVSSELAQQASPLPQEQHSWVAKTMLVEEDK